MITRLMLFWNYFRNSLWALPIAMLIAASALAAIAGHLRVPADGNAVWWLYSGDSAAATGFLGSMLTAMITLAALAISITMVVLTLAAQSLGPRLISIFMGDIRTRLILGTLIGTVTYLLVLLRTIAGTTESVPQFAVTLGTVLVLTSVILLLFFVHHLARSIVADTIIARVGDALDRRSRALLPEGDTAGAEDAGALQSRAAVDGAAIKATKSGYLQTVEKDALVSAAEEAGAMIAIAHRPGQFILPDQTIAWVTPAVALDDLTGTVRDACVQGTERTEVQDLEYSVRQLVEVALRALSPGVNDPFTALAVIDRLAASLAFMMRRGAQQSVWRDSGGSVRLAVPASSIDGIVDAAFHQIRQAGADQPAILIRLADRLGDLLAAVRGGAAGTIRRHLELLRATGMRAIPDDTDRDELSARVEAALRNGKGSAAG